MHLSTGLTPRQCQRLRLHHIYLSPIHVLAGSRKYFRLAVLLSDIVLRHMTFNYGECIGTGCAVLPGILAYNSPFILAAISLFSSDVDWVVYAYEEGTFSETLMTVLLGVGVGLEVCALLVFPIAWVYLGNVPTLVGSLIMFGCRGVLIILTLKVSAAFYTCCSFLGVIILVLAVSCPDFSNEEDAEMHGKLVLLGMTYIDLVVALSLGIGQGDWWAVGIAILDCFGFSTFTSALGSSGLI